MFRIATFPLKVFLIAVSPFVRVTLKPLYIFLRILFRPTWRFMAGSLHQLLEVLVAVVSSFSWIGIRFRRYIYVSVAVLIMVYVVALVFFCFNVVVYVYVYAQSVPEPAMKVPIFIDYSAMPPSYNVTLIPPHAKEKNGLRHEREDGDDLPAMVPETGNSGSGNEMVSVLASGEVYAVELRLALPSSDINDAAGMFTVELQLVSGSGEESIVLHAFKRSGRLSYHSKWSEVIDWIWSLPWWFIFGKSDVEIISFPLLEQHVESGVHPLSGVDFRLLAQRELHVVDASLLFTGQFSGFRYWYINYKYVTGCLVCLAATVIETIFFAGLIYFGQERPAAVSSHHEDIKPKRKPKQQIQDREKRIQRRQSLQRRNSDGARDTSGVGDIYEDIISMQAATMSQKSDSARASPSDTTTFLSLHSESGSASGPAVASTPENSISEGDDDDDDVEPLRFGSPTSGSSTTSVSEGSSEVVSESAEDIPVTLLMQSKKEGGGGGKADGNENDNVLRKRRGSQ
jgi:hypothetical protein